MPVPASEMQGMRKVIEILLRRWHPDLKEGDVLSKQVLEEAFRLPVLVETPSVPSATR